MAQKKKKKFDTNTNISNKRETEEQVNWKQIKIRENTLERLKIMAVSEKKEMQEIADKVLKDFLDSENY
jgi:hypothetical protein